MTYTLPLSLHLNDLLPDICLFYLEYMQTYTFFSMIYEYFFST